MSTRSQLRPVAAVIAGVVAAVAWAVWPQGFFAPGSSGGADVVAVGTPDGTNPTAPSERSFGLPDDGRSRTNALSGEPHHERPKDPPARRHVLDARGRAPAAHVSFGPFSAVQVNVDENGLDVVGDAANEPSMAVDPTDPGRIVIGWRQFDSVTSSFRSAGFAYSHDAGSTWTAGVLGAERFGTDPVVAADGLGQFYYSSLTCLDYPGCSDARVHVFKSFDGGVTWPQMNDAYGGDKQWFAVDDRPSGTGSGHIYQYWTATISCCPPANFTRSTDAGLSFEPPVALPDPGAKWGTLDVAPDGVLFLAGATPDSIAHVVMRSTLAGDPVFSPFFELVEEVDLGGYSVGLAGIDSPNPTGLMGQVWIAVDPQDPDRVYMLASVRPDDGDPLDVYFIRSTDGGKSWSAPLAVHDNAGDGTWQWFGMLSVAPDGRLDVAWNDTRANPEDPTLSQLYYAHSFDGGKTWSDGIAVTPVFDSHLGYPTESKLGDYNQMDSTADGVHIAFAATFNGGQDVYYLRIPAPEPPFAPMPEPGGVDKNRFISFVVPVNGEPEMSALRVRLASLYDSAGTAGLNRALPGGAPDFSGFEGDYRYVRLFRDGDGEPIWSCPDSLVLGDYACAALACEPEYRDWSGEFGGEVLHVTGPAVVPSSAYDVAILDATCAGIEDDCPAASEELRVSTAPWGDIVPPEVNVLDIAAQVDKLVGLATAAPESRTLVHPNEIQPAAASTDVLDIGFVVDAVKGFAYPFTGPEACP